MIVAALETAVVQGTVVSRSVLLDKPACQTFIGALTWTDDGRPLSVALTLQASLTPGEWRPVATAEWSSADGTAPNVVWTGLARRVRLLLDLSRPASAGATIEVR